MIIVHFYWIYRYALKKKSEIHVWNLKLHHWIHRCMHTIYTFSIYENWISIYEDPYYFLYGIWKKSKHLEKISSDGLWIADNFLFHKKLASLAGTPVTCIAKRSKGPRNKWEKLFTRFSRLWGKYLCKKIRWLCGSGQYVNTK